MAEAKIIVSRAGRTRYCGFFSDVSDHDDAQAGIELETHDGFISRGDLMTIERRGVKDVKLLTHEGWVQAEALL